MASIFVTSFSIVAIFIAIGLQSRERISKQTANIVYVTAVLFCIAFALTMKFGLGLYSQTVTIEATGERNPSASGNGVGIKSVSGVSNLFDAVVDGHWVRQSGKLMYNSSAVTSTISLRVSALKSSEISFNFNKWGGIVRITSGGKTETLDLFSNTTEEKSV